MSLLPIHYRHLIAADDFHHVDPAEMGPDMAIGTRFGAGDLEARHLPATAVELPSAKGLVTIPPPGMTESKVITLMRQHLEAQFPKVCPNCKRTFATLREYLLLTKHIGPPIPYDAELGDWNPLQPVGTMTLSNCPCGTTLALSSHGMPLPQLWRLLNWARVETRQRGMTPQELLNYLRDEICRQVLAEPETGDI